MDVNRLVRMANQIAINFQHGPNKQEAAAATLDHISRFWSSPMREQIIVYFRAGETELNEVANIAVSGLAEGKRHVV